MVFALKTFKHWLSRPHRVAVGFLVFALSTYGVLQTLPVGAAACAQTSGTDVVLENCDLAPGSYYYSGTLTITGTVTAGDDTTPGQVIIFADNITISSTGTLTADFLGDAANGSGLGTPNSNHFGGAYGGYGGIGSAGGTYVAETYGSATSPSDVGSGGSRFNGTFPDGGGALKIVTTSTGTLTVDGTITADGEASQAGTLSGGGSGGSIWVVAGTIAGSGELSADGGDGKNDCCYRGGGGGGGRISINYVSSSQSWNVHAYGGNDGGTGAFDGGAGTIFWDDTDDADTNGALVIDNGDRTKPSPTPQVVGIAETYDDITIKSGAQYEIPNTSSLTLVSGGGFVTGGTEQAKLSIDSGGTFDSSSSTFLVDDIDFTHEGDLATTVDLLVQAGTYVFDTETGTFGGNDDNRINDVTLLSGGTFSTQGLDAFNVTNLTIQSGGTMTHEANTTTELNKLIVSATTSVLVQSGGTIDISDKGYSGNNGPGAGGSGTDGGGAGYGGVGGDPPNGTEGGTYGSVREPDDLGSGGGNTGGAGGGALKIVTTGTVTVDGTVVADGEEPFSGTQGGGSGGSVWIDTGTLDGDGSIEADGENGNSWGGPGAGGRIAVYYTTDNSTLISGTDKIHAWGDDAESWGTSGDSAAGTIFLSDKTGSGDLIVDNNNLPYTNRKTTQVEKDLTFDNITIRDGAEYNLSVSGYTLTLSATGTLTGGGTDQPLLVVPSGTTFDPSTASFEFNDLDVDLDGTVATVTTLGLVDADFDHDGAFSATVTQLNFNASTGSTYFRHNGTGFNDLTLDVDDNGIFVAETTSYDNLTSLTVGNTGTFEQAHTSTIDITSVTVQSGGTMTHTANTTTHAYELDLNGTTIDIQTGGTVDVSEKGYSGNNGPGAGLSGTDGGGGAYGGGGADPYNGTPGESYGSVREPSDLGSGGGNTGGSGGGAVKLVASGTLTVNGTIVSDGQRPTSGTQGGGAGGSIWLDAGTLDGDGSLKADGEVSNSWGGAGGGGRIAIYYTTDNSTLISGAKYSAYGNVGEQVPTQIAAAGSVFIDDRTGSGDLIIDNGDRDSNRAETTQIDASETYDNITISSGAEYRIGSGRTLTLSATGTLTGGGTTQSQMLISSGGTFDTGATTFEFNDIDVDNDGAVATVTTLQLADSDFDHDGDLSATVTQLDFNAATASFFRNNGTGFNDLTLLVDDYGTFVSETTSYDNLTSLIIGNTGTFEQSHTTTLNITTATIQSGGTLTHTLNAATQAYDIDIAATTFDLQSGGAIDADGKGYASSEGTGAGGDGVDGGGGGYGGAGGKGACCTNGGSTYGSATAPGDLGSGGGDDTGSGGQQGGPGGGAVKLVITGTLTVNGSITADGGNAISGIDGGGGSGGSVWLDADTYAGTTGTITADGGNAVRWGGAGGGGRIYITYNTKTYSGSTPTVVAGSPANCGASCNGSAGTFTEEQKAPTVPTINSIYVTPGTPTDAQSFTISASATFESGLDYVELFLDGTELTNRVAICYSGTATNTSCTYEHGPVSGGSHTAYVKATGDDASTATSSVAFFVSTNTTENVATLERHKAGESTSFALTFTLTNTLSSQLTITFPGSFTVTGAFTSGTCTSGTISNFGFTSTTLTADKSSCTGTVTLTGATITLPGTAGLYEVTWENDDPGSVIIPVTDDDQVTVSADVASELTFDLDIATSDSDTAAPYTLALGSLTSGSPAGSDDSGVSGIWVDLDTNATGGAVVQVQSTNASLASASAPGDTIPSSSGDVNGGTTARYGICVATAGSGVPTATVGTFQSVAPFSGATGGALGCTTTNSSVGALTTSFQTILNTNSNPIDGGRAQIRVKVDISDSTVGHDDYSDTLTFRATSTF